MRKMENNSELIFIFDDIFFLSDRDLLTLLKEIENTTLLHACSKCDDFVLLRVAGVLSNLARSYFYEDLTKTGVVSDHLVAEAQLSIAIMMNELYSDGQFLDLRPRLAA